MDTPNTKQAGSIPCACGETLTVTEFDYAGTSVTHDSRLDQISCTACGLLYDAAVVKKRADFKRT